MSHGHPRRVCALPLLGRVSCACVLGLGGLSCWSCPLFPYFCLVVLSIIESWVLKPPIIITEMPISTFNSTHFLHHIFDGLLLAVWTYSSSKSTQVDSSSPAVGWKHGSGGWKVTLGGADIWPVCSRWPYSLCHPVLIFIIILSLG